MGTTYLNELAKWNEQRSAQKRRQDQAAVAFMAVKPQVVEAINNGYSLATIWEHMHSTGKVDCSYETFRRHVKRFVVTVASPFPTLPFTSPAQPQAHQPKRKTDTRKTTPTGQVTRGYVGGFKFDATARKEDLI
jgi:hypothetical protein